MSRRYSIRLEYDIGWCRQAAEKSQDCSSMTPASSMSWLIDDAVRALEDCDGQLISLCAAFDLFADLQETLRDGLFPKLLDEDTFTIADLSSIEKAEVACRAFADFLASQIVQIRAEISRDARADGAPP